jgi:hypothetical protein
LVYADNELWKGSPRPITLDRAKMKLRIDLPGMRSDGNLEIDQASNSKVQTKIEEALEWWNGNAYEEGYVNPSSSEYESSVVYSSTQLGLDVSMNVEWATGAVSSQQDYDKNSEKSVAVMVFKQVFYNITMDTPQSPADVFSSDISLQEVQNAVDAEAPPAYISNVAYGRIVMFRLEVENLSESVDLNAVLNYAAGVNVDVETNTEYDAVLNRSTIKVITIGGDAEVASEAVSATGIASLNHILTGENAVYSRNNPGVPIAYTIKFLKDNSVAKMGYTTDYSIENCSEHSVKHRRIRVKNKFKIKNIRAYQTAILSNGAVFEPGWITIKDETYEGKLLDAIPDGSYDVKLLIEKYNLGNGWTYFKQFNIGHVISADEACYSAYEVNNNERCTRCSDE